MKRAALFLTLIILLLAAPAFAAPPYDRIIKSGETVDGNVTVIDSDLLIEGGGTVNGDVQLFNGTAEVAGTIDGDVALFDGAMTLTGVIHGDVVVFGGDLEIGEGAIIRGDCAVLGGQVDDNSTDAACANVGADAGRFLDNLPFAVMGDGPPSPPARPTALATVGSYFLRVSEVVGRSLFLGLLALVVASLFPQQLARVSTVARREPVTSGALGVLTAVAVPSLMAILFVVLAITCVGIILYPAVILIGVALGVAAVLGWIALGTRLGQWLAGPLHLKNRSIAVTATLGTAALTLFIGALQVFPALFLGDLAAFLLAGVIGSIGLGAAALTRFGTKDYPRLASGGADKIDGVMADTLPPK